MGRLFKLIEDHMDGQQYRPSERDVARALGVSPTTLANWRDPKKLIEKEHLLAIANLTGNPYIRVLDALLDDIGYSDPHATTRARRTS